MMNEENLSDDFPEISEAIADESENPVELDENAVADEQMDAGTPAETEVSVIQLDETVSSEHTERLAETILQHRNSNLEIDATNVTRVDTTCIEVLLAAAKLWVADHCRLSISNPSEEFMSSLNMLGLERYQLETGDY